VLVARGELDEALPILRAEVLQQKIAQLQARKEQGNQ
jgi:hypothetical protein